MVYTFWCPDLSRTNAGTSGSPNPNPNPRPLGTVRWQIELKSAPGGLAASIRAKAILGHMPKPPRPECADNVLGALLVYLNHCVQPSGKHHCLPQPLPIFTVSSVVSISLPLLYPKGTPPAAVTIVDHPAGTTGLFSSLMPRVLSCNKCTRFLPQPRLRISGAP